VSFTESTQSLALRKKGGGGKKEKSLPFWVGMRRGRGEEEKTREKKGEKHRIAADCLLLDRKVRKKKEREGRETGNPNFYCRDQRRREELPAKVVKGLSIAKRKGKERGGGRANTLDNCRNVREGGKEGKGASLYRRKKKKKKSAIRGRKKKEKGGEGFFAGDGLNETKKKGKGGRGERAQKKKKKEERVR